MNIGTLDNTVHQLTIHTGQDHLPLLPLSAALSAIIDIELSLRRVTVQLCTVLLIAALHCTTLLYFVSHWTAMPYTDLHCTKHHCRAVCDQGSVYSHSWLGHLSLRPQAHIHTTCSRACPGHVQGMVDQGMNFKYLTDLVNSGMSYTNRFVIN